MRWQVKRKIIDMHVHCFPPHIAQYALKATALRGNFAGDGTIVGERQIMKRFGITCSVMLSMATRPDTQDDVNRFAMQVNSKDIIAFGSVHPFSPNAIEAVEKLYENGIKGIKFHTSHQQFDISDDRCRPLYKRIGQLGMITVIHGGKSLKRVKYWAWPSEVSKVIDCFQGAPFILAHMGGMNIDKTELNIVKDMPVFVDTAMANRWLSQDEFYEDVQEIGVERVFFGSDLPWGDIGTEIKFVQNAQFTEQEKGQIFYDNAIKILKL